MALDGLVISNIVHDLNNSILNGRITKIYQPENDEILLIIKNNKNTYRLILSAQASLPLIYLTDKNKTNPLTPPNFCMLLRKHINNGKITKITQPNFERIVEIYVEHLNELGDLCTKKIIIEIMGRHSNIIFCDKDNNIIDSIKHIPGHVSSVREVLPGREYFYPPNKNKKDPRRIIFDDFINNIKNKSLPIYKCLYTSFTGLSPLIANEICYRASIDSNKQISSLEEKDFLSLYYELNSLMEVVENGNFTPIIVYENKIPNDFSSIILTSLNNLESEKYDSISKVLQNFYETKAVLTRIKQKSTDIRKVIQNALERCYKKFDLQSKQLKDTKKRDKYKIYGELILAYSFQIKEGQTKLEAYDYYNEKNVVIKLDPTLTPPENSQKYYAKYNKLKRTFEALQLQIEETRKEIEHLESINSALDIAETEDDLSEIRKELIDYGYLKKKLKDKKSNQPPSRPIHYLSSDGFHIYVGKNNFQNDNLSFKFASNNDWWFHTKEIPGSHVIVKTNSETLTDKTFEEAAAIAAYYSKARSSSKVAVDYTLKKNLKKPNGAKPGYVIYHTNYSVYVEPSLKNVTLIHD